MHSLIFLLTRRYLIEAQAHRTLNQMVKICFFSIFLASCAIALIVSITHGFEHATIQTLQGIHADAHIESLNTPIDDATIRYLKNHPLIQSISPYKESQALLALPDNENFQPIGLRAINPKKEKKTTALEKTLIKKINKENLEHILIERNIIIGNRLAEMLAIEVGSVLNLFYAPEPPTGNKLHLDKIEVTVAGIFKTGIDEFDAGIAFCNLSLFDDLFDQEIHQIALSLKKNIPFDAAIKKLKKNIPYPLFSWIELYPPLYAAIQMERYAMIAVLALIALICTITIIALIFMLIAHKKNDIAILRSMGLSLNSIKLLFLMITSCICIPASALGLVTAWIIGILLQTTIRIPLPDAYFSCYLPIELNIFSFFAIGLTVVFLAFCGAFFALRSLAYLQLSETLR